jgi:hypothetical protein
VSIVAGYQLSNKKNSNFSSLNYSYVVVPQTSHKMFGEMTVSTLSFDSFFAVIVSHVSWLASIIIFRYISVSRNPISRADRFSIAIWS